MLDLPTGSPLSEDQIERFVERRADALFLNGRLTEDEYLSAASEIDSWAKARLREAKKW